MITIVLEEKVLGGVPILDLTRRDRQRMEAEVIENKE